MEHVNETKDLVKVSTANIDLAKEEVKDNLSKMVTEPYLLKQTMAEGFPIDMLVESGTLRYYQNANGKEGFNYNNFALTELVSKLYNVKASPTLPFVYIYNHETGVWDTIPTNTRTTTELAKHIANHIKASKRTKEYLLMNSSMSNALEKVISDIATSIAERAISEGANTPLNPTNRDRKRNIANLIAFKNGTYNFETNEIIESNHTHYHTFALPYDLIPTNDTDNPIKEWFDWVMEDSAQTMYEWIGYLYYREYKYNTIMFMVNDINTPSGSNGKSQIGAFIQDKLLPLGLYSSTPLDQLTDKNNKFAKTTLYNKMLNFEADSGADFMKGTDILKRLSGNDWVEGEFKGKDQFSFKNYAKLMFSMNDLPKFADTSRGWSRRLLVTTFPKDLYKPEYQSVLDKFNTEKEIRNSDENVGKFAWFCIQQFRNNILSKPTKGGETPFTQSESMKERKAQYLHDNNKLERVIETLDFIKKGKPQYKEQAVTSTMMKKLFKQYQEEERDLQKMTPVNFIKEMKLAYDIKPMGLRDINGNQSTVRAFEGLYISTKGSETFDTYKHYLDNELVNILDSII